jgi:hypothetical protein
MKKLGTAGLFVIISMVSLGAVRADGILELRAGAGLTGADPSAFEDRVNSLGGGGLSADKFESFNADIFFNIPVSPLGIGVRHEWINSSQGNGPSSWDLKANNLSLMVDLRLIDSVVYFGPIVSVGYPWADLDFSSNSASINHQIDRDQLSYSGGLEAGLILGRFIIGAEAGYQSLKFNQNDTTTGVNSELDLSGPYGKAMVGMTFF